MGFRVYEFKAYLNASHSITLRRADVHPHTFLITLYARRLTRHFGKFEHVDVLLSCYFSQFAHQIINDIPPFDLGIPTVERMGDVFFEDLKRSFESINYDLIQLEIGETPLRVYAVSDRLFMDGRILAGA